jgi:peptidylprolyl isomerase
MNFAKGSPPVVANGKVYVASISNFVSVYGLREGAKEPKTPNLALNRQVTATAPCEPTQTADKAVNGSAQSGPTDKWCSSAEKPYLQIDLGKPVEVGRFVVEHAGAGGDDFLQNTREFNIEVSQDGEHFQQVVDVWNNIQSITTHDIRPTTARYVRMNIVQPAQLEAAAAVANVANIYEFEVLPPVVPVRSDLPAPAKANASLAAADPPVKTPPAPPDVAAPAGEDVEYTTSHVAMKVLQAGSGDDRPEVNDCVLARFNMWERDGELFASSLNDAEIVCVRTAILGISQALRRMVPGEKRRVWIPADATYRMGQMHRMHARPEEDEAPPHEDLTCDIELVKVLHAPPTPTHLTAPPLNALHTASGLAYELLSPGSGTAHPAPNSTVKVHFTGWTNDGTLFESTMMTGHPAVLSLAAAMPGWREGVTHMTVGQKARFWIPAALAFGTQPADRFNPAGDLIYEIELLGIQ